MTKVVNEQSKTARIFWEDEAVYSNDVINLPDHFENHQLNCTVHRGSCLIHQVQHTVKERNNNIVQSGETSDITHYLKIVQ